MQTRSGGPEWTALLESISDNSLGSGFDQNWYIASVGGPVPGLRKAYIFGLVERRYFGDRSPSYGTERSLAGSPTGLPGNWLKGWSYNARFDYNINDNLILTATADASIDEWSRYIHNYYYNWKHLPYYQDKNLALGAKLEHHLTPTFDLSLRVSLFKTEHFGGDGIQRENITDYVRPYANPELDPYQLFYSWDDEDGVTADYDESSYWNDYEKQKSSRLNIGLEAIKRLGRSHSLKTGLEWQRHALRAFRNLNPANTQGITARYISYIGYDTLGNETDDGGTEWGNEVRHPTNLAFYLEDRIQFGGLTATAGIRFELYDSDARTVKDVKNPFDPDGSGDYEMDLEDTKAAPSHSRWSPRVSLVYATPVGVKLHGGIAVHNINPGFSQIHSDWHFFEARVGAGSYYPHANGELSPIKSTNYEAGIGYAYPGLLSIDATLFRRNTNERIRIHFQSSVIPFGYDHYANYDLAEVTGFDLSLEVTPISMASFRVNYTRTRSSSTGVYATSTYNIAWKNPAGIPLRTYPTHLDRNRELTTSIQIHTPEAFGPKLAGFNPFERFNLTVVAQQSTGLSYTPTDIANEIGTRSFSIYPIGPVNSAKGPLIRYIDLRLERTFATGSFQITPFLWIKNLRDRSNIIYVYSGTGCANETGYLETPEGQGRINNDEQNVPRIRPGFEERYKLLERNPLNYANPRQVMFGMRITF
ncbi:MAG: hypothetical protein GY832_36360 [Chloroflexi bacterium]|nr:hypothetical protein [Chloroflexota bacterium]